MNMNKQSIKKVAFTLAEVLLTLTIIGVLMAIMLRSISRVNPDKDKILFLKSYHSVEAAVANIISDPSKYDQNTEENGDFSTIPLATAFANINGTVYCTPAWQNPDASKGETGVQCSNTEINQSNALCYFLAEQINFIGGFDCSAGDKTLNFKSTNGVCFYGWGSFGSDSIEGMVDPTCEGKDGYKIKVFKEGKMTVEDGADGTLQHDAYRWIQDQTQIKN